MKELAERGEKWARAQGRSPYDVMNNEDIYSLPVGDIAAKNSILFLWVTWPKLLEGIETIKRWGFTYKSRAFTWVKTNKVSTDTFFFGMGFWTHANDEVCLLATKGHPKRVGKAVASLVVHPLMGHSAKPPQIRDYIVELMGDLPRVELFARETCEGWVSLGDEIDGKDMKDALREIIEAQNNAKQLGLFKEGD